MKYLRLHANIKSAISVRMLITAAAILLLPQAAVLAQGWKPARNVEIIIPTTTGGSADRTGRFLQKLFQEKGLVETSTVVNRPGGSGTVGMHYLLQQGKLGNHILIHTEPLVSNRITTRSNLSYADFTPIALLTTEYMVFSVNANSPIKTGKDLVEMLRRDPASVSISGGSAIGNNSHMAIGQVGQIAKFDSKKLKIVVFNSGGEATAALLGGHIDALITTVIPVMPHIQSGKLRAIAITAPQRLSGPAAIIPTWKEQGIDMTYASWRVAVANKGLTPEQLAFWDNTFRQVTSSDEWKKDLEANYLQNAYLDRARTQQYLDAQNKQLTVVLKGLGLAK
jgi:putative tricarboxylic transport membrane protein